VATGSDDATHVVWYNGKQGSTGVYYARRAQSQSTGPAVSLEVGQGLGVAHPAVAALPDGGALAAYDVSPDGKRGIHLARLGADGRVEGRHAVIGSEHGKYPHLVVLNDSIAVVGWTGSARDAPALQLARIDLRAGRR
jgi:hypothetical protein